MENWLTMSWGTYNKEYSKPTWMVKISEPLSKLYWKNWRSLMRIILNLRDSLPCKRNAFKCSKFRYVGASYDSLTIMTISKLILLIKTLFSTKKQESLCNFHNQPWTSLRKYTLLATRSKNNKNQRWNSYSVVHLLSL